MVWWNTVNKAVDPSSQEPIKVIIPKGLGVTDIGELLKEKGLIRNVWGFRVLVSRNKLKNQLQAGSYTLTKSQNLEEIAQSLTKGVEDFWVTIPEGKRREEVAAILRESYVAQGLEFSIPAFMDASQGFEGYLFPDTYLLPRSITEEEIVSFLRSTFDKKVTHDLSPRLQEAGLGVEEVIILASLIEREAKHKEDRAKIAGVVLNRLEIGMPLQIDASVQYAVGQAQCQGREGQECNWWPVLRETTFSSPYNTYEHPGLPPAPICNPGLSVIEAALNPEEHDYLYYLSEPSGVTHYAQTLEEHNANIEKYLN